MGYISITDMMNALIEKNRGNLLKQLVLTKLSDEAIREEYFRVFGSREELYE